MLKSSEAQKTIALIPPKAWFIEIGPTVNNEFPPLVRGDPNTQILPEYEKGCKMSSSCLEMAHFLHIEKKLKQLLNSNSLMAGYSPLHDKLFI